jgi:lysine N6-hydroxylase
VNPAGTDRDVDLLGVGLGPFNLSLAALLEPVRDVAAVFCEQQPSFSWHPGLLLEGTTTQVPFLADLVTLVDPGSQHSFLEYLREHDRLYRFYFREQFHVPRREYDHYCRWVADRLSTPTFRARVEALRWTDGRFEAEIADPADGTRRRLRARNVVLGVGGRPHVPAALQPVLGPHGFHSADFTERREAVHGAAVVSVIGSGQSGAEVFAELLREQPRHGYRLDWLTRSAGFFPMEYTPLALEHFTPDYIRYFHQLPEPVRSRLLPTQDLLYKGIDAETIAGIHDLLYERTVGGAHPAVRLLPHAEIVAAAAVPAAEHRFRLRCRQWEQGEDFELGTDCVVMATGYRAAPPPLLDPIRPLIAWDAAGRLRVDLDYRVATDPAVRGSLFVQNAELHTHGVGAPDLGLGAHRAATIVNALTRREVYRLPLRTAFTDFEAFRDG